MQLQHQQRGLNIDMSALYHEGQEFRFGADHMKPAVNKRAPDHHADSFGRRRRHISRFHGYLHGVVRI